MEYNGGVMSYKNLESFIDKLEEAGELRRIKVEVDPVLEITEITDRVSKSGGPALLFEKVKGSEYPLLINAMGSYKRMALALGVEAVSYTHLRAHETDSYLVCRLLLEKKKKYL